ncbi:MAG TPA: LarC family nickel insertion protein [Holophagaceae bacterium]|nr:LarC family nickel insertion protein [Holophagaceae bacterium]
MSHLWLDPFSGLSGDLWVAAFAALGAPEAELRATLRKLPFDDVDLRLETTMRCGLEGLRASMVIGGRVDAGGEEVAHIELPAGAKRLSKRRVVKGAHEHGPSWKEVDTLLAERLPGPVGDRARGAFERLGRAEARVHGTTIEQVHFHEVGLKDSIADVALAAAGFVALGEPVIHVGAVATGRGRVRMAHGDYPIPAPAALYLLEGFETIPGSAPEDKELCTPTGAALAAELATFRKAPPRFIPELVAYACGGWDFPNTPNVLRLLWGRVPQEASSLVQIETNVDDATPQQVAFTQEQLLEAGAVDAWVIPATFKKGRSGWIVSALVPASRLEEVQQRLVAELPTLGVRTWPVQRTEAERRFIESRVEGVRVPVKEGIWPHGATRQPEFEDAARAARESGLPLRAVQGEALKQADVPAATARGRQRRKP